MNELDKKCFELAIEIAEKTYKGGNFPVGAVLVIDDKIIDSAGNERGQQKSWVAHAENTLIIKNGEIIQKAHKENKVIKIYSTLEPCIQCLGTSVANRISEILYIQKDPIRGACDLKPTEIGLWYEKNWPKIYQHIVNDKPRQLLVEYFQERIKSDSSDWTRKCYDFYNKA